MATRQPTQIEIAALRAFAAAHGRNWKSELVCTYWYNARVWNGLHVLHAIRNTFGPKWLYRFKLPKPD